MVSVSPTPMSEEAVLSMLKNEETSDPLVVGITTVQPLSKHEGYFQCKIFDGVRLSKALIALSKDMRWIQTHQSALKILVHGYTSSYANYGISYPFLCIDSFSIVESTSTKRMGRHHSMKQEKIQGGKASTFISKYAPLLSNSDLAGTHACGVLGASLDHERAKSIHDFMAQHSAMSILRSSFSGSSLEGSSTNYMKALQEFASAQLDRQKASLQTNAGPEDATKSKQMQEQYMTALNVAWEHAETTDELTVTVLKKWHGILVGNGLHEEAGVLRNTNARASATAFTPKEKLEEDLESLLAGLQRLESRLIRLTSFEDQERGLGVITFAAAVFFGIDDVHPFSDGNGRLSRIALNWALRRGGLPFVINLFATQTQRTASLGAVRTTRRNTYLECHGKTEEPLWNAFRNAGGMLPLVNLILDRVSRAAVEFDKLVAEKSSLANEEAETRAARRFRERAAAGTCMICFDDDPNIATLCCGKAAHLNCIAKWLGERSSCPQCRASLPALPRRNIVEDDDDTSSSEEESESDESDSDESSAIAVASDDDDDSDSEAESSDAVVLDDSSDDDSEDTSDDEMPSIRDSCDCNTVVAVQRSLDGNGVADDSDDSDDDSSEESSYDDDETIDDESVDDESADDESVDDEGSAAAVAQNPVCVRGFCQNLAASNCNNRCCGRCCLVYGELECHRHVRTSDASATPMFTGSTASSSSDDDETSDPPSGDEATTHDDSVTQVASGSNLPFCSRVSCRNRAASDCINTCCGRCCVLHGRLRCQRHYRELGQATRHK